MKIRPVGPELFHTNRKTDGRTDMMNLLVAFRNFANAPTNTLCSNRRQRILDMQSNTVFI